eukprot:2171171-Prymnesium_polylepis.1
MIYRKPVHVTGSEGDTMLLARVDVADTGGGTHVELAPLVCDSVPNHAPPYRKVCRSLHDQRNHKQLRLRDSVIYRAHFDGQRRLVRRGLLSQVGGRQ